VPRHRLQVLEQDGTNTYRDVLFHESIAAVDRPVGTAACMLRIRA
jgi:hypothetical protein